MNLTEVISKIRSVEDLILFGAQTIAYEIYIALSEVFQIKPKCFLVSSMENNPKDIDDIPVIPLSSYQPINGQLILVATPQPYHGQIVELLSEYENVDYMCVDSQLEYIILSEYFRKKTPFKLLEDYSVEGVKGSQSADFRIMMAKSHFDVPLKFPPDIKKWVYPIHVGAAMTDKDITSIKDNSGENISMKNRNYCELTATYWLWKNIRSDYKGLFHYRRTLELDKKDLEKVLSNDIDVVLPLPYVCNPDTSGQYKRYISSEDIQLTFDILGRMRPEYYNAAQSILADKYLYNYNMLIAKADVFNDFCNWLFPLLEEIEKHYSEKSICREDRYIGYIGELLTSLYFLYNRNNLKIAHGKKIWFI